MYPKNILKLTLTILLFSFFSFFVSHAQQVENIAINYIEATANDDIGGVDVSGYVFASDANGNPIYGLNRESFVVIQDGQPIEIESAEIAKDPITIIIAIDTSGSMALPVQGGRTALDFAKEAAVNFIQTLTEEDQVAIYSFSFREQIILHQELTIDHGAAINAVHSVNWGEYAHTCLYDGAIRAIETSLEVPTGRRAVIILTDGVDSTDIAGEECSINTQGDVIDKATNSTSKVPLFTVGFGEIDEDVLTKMAKDTGGRSLIAPEATELNSLFGSISNQLKNQYLIKYHTEVASGEHSVVVKVGNISDDSRVFIPTSKVAVVAEPTRGPTATHTPAPELTLNLPGSLKINTPKEGMLTIPVEVFPEDQVERFALYIDQQRIEEKHLPPFDKFEITMSDFEPGERAYRIEVTDKSGKSQTREGKITIPERDAPATQATPVPTESEQTLMEQYGLFIAIAVILLIIIIGLIAFFTSRKKEEEIPEYEPDATEFISEDAGVGPDPYSTMDNAMPGGGHQTAMSSSAHLEVIEGMNVVSSNSFPINRNPITIGRNEGGVINDIDIPDKSVSRRHAEISQSGGRFTIRDKGSRYGTTVNGQGVSSAGGEINNGDTIGIGRRIKLKFVDSSSGGTDLFATMDTNFDDPHRTMMDS